MRRSLNVTTLLMLQRGGTARLVAAGIYQGTGAFTDSRFRSRPVASAAASPPRGIHCVTGRYPVMPADPAAQHQSNQCAYSGPDCPAGRAPAALRIFSDGYAAGHRVRHSLRL